MEKFPALVIGNTFRSCGTGALRVLLPHFSNLLNKSVTSKKKNRNKHYREIFENNWTIEAPIIQKLSFATEFKITFDYKILLELKDTKNYKRYKDATLRNAAILLKSHYNDEFINWLKLALIKKIKF